VQLLLHDVEVHNNTLTSSWNLAVLLVYTLFRVMIVTYEVITS